MSEFTDAMAELLRQRAQVEAEQRERTERVAALRQRALVDLHRQLSRLVQTINLKAGAAGTLSLDPVELPLWLSGHDQVTITLRRPPDSVDLQVDSAEQMREPDPGVLATARLCVIKPLVSTTAFVAHLALVEREPDQPPGWVEQLQDKTRKPLPDAFAEWWIGALLR